MAYPYYTNYPMSNYQPQMLPTQMSVTNQSNGQITWVQGEAAARSFMVPANTSAILMDSEKEVFYIKTTDQAGMPLPLRTFSYKEMLPEVAKVQIEDKMYATVDDYNALKVECDALKEEIKKLSEKLNSRRKTEVKDE